MRSTIKDISILILVSISIAFLQSCGDSEEKPFEPQEETHYIDANFIIIEKGDEYYNSGFEHYFIIKKINKPFYFKYTYRTLKEIKDKKFYSHALGDTLHFDYIQKKKFWNCETFYPINTNTNASYSIKNKMKK